METQVIVVDDDPIVGSLTLELLQDAGIQAGLIQDSLQAQERIKKERPLLVILDILMPGIDGLTLLHRLKSDPETRGIRAIVVSGKTFDTEKERAKQYGAEEFIEKPYDVEGFAAKIKAILAEAGAPAAPPAPTPAARARAALPVKVWGFRAPGAPAGSRRGTRTSCVSVELPGALIAFDAGTGLQALAEQALAGRRELWLFLANLRPERVGGLAGLRAARDPSFTLNVGAASEPDKPLDEALTAAFGGTPPSCRIELYELIEQSYEILPGVRLTAFHANHPGATLGFALHAQGRKIVYSPDGEVYGEFATSLQDYDEKLGGLVRGADLMFHDGRFTDDDYAANRNKGCSSVLSVVDVAGRNAVKRLVLVEPDSRYDDAQLDAMEAAAKARAAERGYALAVELAREGLSLTV